jgi:hypothetical protein
MDKLDRGKAREDLIHNRAKPSQVSLIPLELETTLTVRLEHTSVINAEAGERRHSIHSSSI